MRIVNEFQALSYNINWFKNCLASNLTVFVKNFKNNHAFPPRNSSPNLSSAVLSRRCGKRYLPPHSLQERGKHVGVSSGKAAQTEYRAVKKTALNAGKQWKKRWVLQQCTKRICMSLHSMITIIYKTEENIPRCLLWLNELLLWSNCFSLNIFPKFPQYMYTTFTITEEK